MNSSLRVLLFLVFVTILSLSVSNAQNEYKAWHADVAPVIDGDSNDAVWSSINTWYTYNQVWLNNVGTTPTAQDFSWKFKLAWDKDRYYILAVVTDDMLSDLNSNPLTNYWEDDCLEVFFDEDNSGGQHQSSFQAWAYHISTKYDIVDSDNTGTARLFNDHANVKMKAGANGKYVWEVAFKVYPSTYTVNNPGQPVTLFAGKQMGWALSYCDNDGRSTRDHFFGSEYIAATNKNIAYQTADVFGTATLMNPVTEIFPHNASEKISVKVYPNPFTESVVIETPEAGTVTVMDAQGRTVLNAIPVKAGENRVALPLEGGYYQLLYEHDGKKEYAVELIECY